MKPQIKLNAILAALLGLLLWSAGSLVYAGEFEVYGNDFNQALRQAIKELIAQGEPELARALYDEAKAAVDSGEIQLVRPAPKPLRVVQAAATAVSTDYKEGNVSGMRVVDVNQEGEQK